MVSSLFAEIPLAPKDPILGITESFNSDPRPDKVNLGVGVYCDENGKLPLLESVRLAEDALSA
ncbi:MAG TPA: aromatic amino acid aminotransferase, partial [Thauera sp.]|nr:aromatic amino acid aminotransferase [Thauera sp.]